MRGALISGMPSSEGVTQHTALAQIFSILFCDIWKIPARHHEKNGQKKGQAF
jgi:hypothetical protein